MEKLGFFQGGYSMVLVKNWQFFYLFNIGKIGQENVFENIVAGKKAFAAYKKKNLNNWKNWDFSKGLVHGFGKKLTIFLSF